MKVNAYTFFLGCSKAKQLYRLGDAPSNLELEELPEEKFNDKLDAASRWLADVIKPDGEYRNASITFSFEKVNIIFNNTGGKDKGHLVSPLYQQIVMLLKAHPYITDVRLGSSFQNLNVDKSNVPQCLWSMREINTQILENEEFMRQKANANTSAPMKPVLIASKTGNDKGGFASLIDEIIKARRSAELCENPSDPAAKRAWDVVRTLEKKLRTQIEADRSNRHPAASTEASSSNRNTKP